MKDFFPYKIYNQLGIIISECSTMEQAIDKAKKLNFSWEYSPNKQVGHLISHNHS